MTRGEGITQEILGFLWLVSYHDAASARDLSDLHAIEVARVAQSRPHDMCQNWWKLDPRRYHAVEVAPGGRRASIALLSPRAWRRIPRHALSEPQDSGLSW